MIGFLKQLIEKYEGKYFSSLFQLLNTNFSFIGPLPRWFCETIIDALMELRPSDVELSFMLCNLCFHLTGQKLGGRIQEITDRLQDVLANDLHKYYLAKDKYSRYSYRLTKLLSLNRQYKVSSKNYLFKSYL